jgi:hypothetical protein
VRGRVFLRNSGAVEGSGTGIYEGVSGQLFFKDNVETGTFSYRGHLRY